MKKKCTQLLTHILKVSLHIALTHTESVSELAASGPDGALAAL